MSLWSSYWRTPFWQVSSSAWFMFHLFPSQDSWSEISISASSGFWCCLFLSSIFLALNWADARLLLAVNGGKVVAIYGIKIQNWDQRTILLLHHLQLLANRFVFTWQSEWTLAKYLAMEACYISHLIPRRRLQHRRGGSSSDWLVIIGLQYYITIILGL